LIFVLPFIDYVGLFWIWCQSRDRYARILLLFLTASFVNVFPRADRGHLAFAAPCLLLSLLYIWQHIKLSSVLRYFVSWGVYGGVLWCFPVLAVYKLAQQHQKTMPCLCRIPHFQGILVHPRIQETLCAELEIIKQNTSTTQPTFFLTPAAGFYYLATGIPNATPFDYPFITTFGKNGMQELMQTLTQHSFKIFIDPHRGKLWPTLLENFVTKNFTPTPLFTQNSFTLYESTQ
jgi:hypothetical protein